MRTLFNHYVTAVRRFGAFRIEPQKTRIVFQVRVRFAGGHALKSGFRGAFWLTEPRPGAPVDRIEKVTPNCYVHCFLLRTREDLNESLLARLGLAYRVGCQDHIKKNHTP